MPKRILFSASSGTPGPMTAFRNYQAALKPQIQCDIVSLDELIAPLELNIGKRLYHHVNRQLKTITVKRILPYGENIIFGNFSPIHNVIISKLNRAGIRPSFMWCSTLGQIELTECERPLFAQLIELLRCERIKYLFLANRLNNSIGYFVREAIFLPYSIDLTPYTNIVRKNMLGVNIDLFCRHRPGKNIINQVLAFKMAGTNGILHINFDQKQFKGIMELISANTKQHRWLSSADYFSLIAGMDLSLQITIGESFNYAVCERMCLGVPVLTSHDIYLVADDKVLAKNLCIQTPDTPSVIARAIKNLIEQKSLRNELAARCKQRIAEVAENHNKIVIEKMQDLFK